MFDCVIRQEWPETCRWRRQALSRVESIRWSSRREMSLHERSKCFSSFCKITVIWKLVAEFLAFLRYFFKLEDNLPPRLAWLLLAGQKPDTKLQTLSTCYLSLSVNQTFWQKIFLEKTFINLYLPKLQKRGIKWRGVVIQNVYLLSPPDDVNLVYAPPNCKSQNNQPRLEIIC